ncbi:MAG: enoyl-CoA hydratase/isomerase family protein [Chloroflexi bacterium]|nr:enoyl-CoA hydratase/isomerase family protein [Chloroflexota bacterium]
MGVEQEQASTLTDAGLPADVVHAWQAGRPTALPRGESGGSALAGDAQVAGRYFSLADDLRGRLPPKADRSEREQAAAEVVLAGARAVRREFLDIYGSAIYAELTEGYRRFLRVDELVYAAAERYPGLVPTRSAVARERRCRQRDKDGLEIDQGLFLADVLARPRPGTHLVNAMLRPLPASLDRLDELRTSGRVDLGAARLERRGVAGYVEMHNPRYLNAEDDTTVEPLEMAIDLVLLDPTLALGVLRGSPAEHPRHGGRRVFSAGINLSHLYEGQISFLFYMTRDLGLVNKLYRGLSAPEQRPLELEATHEKPWIAAVESFAIGGGCQLLLVMDRVLAEQSSYFNLPARKEGIIPGVANMRLPRLVGERLARAAILFDQTFAADSSEGRLLCDQVVPDGEMDGALAGAVDALTGSGVVSADGNRKALRVGLEPLQLFREYMSVYAREQAFCHFSPQLIRNLEQNWLNRRRTL